MQIKDEDKNGELPQNRLDTRLLPNFGSNSFKCRKVVFKSMHIGLI
jgi:hypothetical protein